ncbi:hypothetical protein [Aeoliella sp. SH292]|uniref:hypothetical protein n=1 Tax=Aeoliella sp. SH292 TaxID=3454464 RepID=UPI003F9CD7DF
MTYGTRNIDYALRVGLVDAAENDNFNDDQPLQYARKRSAKAIRKRGRKPVASPGCGIAARSNRRYSI